MIANIAFLKIQKKGRKRLLKSVLKSILFYLISLPSLFITASNNHVLNWNNNSFWIWILFLIILIIPIFLFRLYQPIFSKTFRGTVHDIKNKEVLVSRKGTAGMAAGYGQIMDLYDECEIIICPSKGRLRSYIFRGPQAKFAREYFKKGDPVLYIRYARYPLNLSCHTDKHFCINCGSIGLPGDIICPYCGIEFIKQNDLKL